MDPSVSCKSSNERTVLMVHAFVVCLVVGVGFPGYVFFKLVSFARPARWSPGSR